MPFLNLSMSKSGKSLNARGHALSDNAYQLKVLSSHDAATAHLPSFESKLDSIGLSPLKPPGIEIFQIPEIDELMKKGQERLRVLMGGRGNGGGGGVPGGSGGRRAERR